MAMEAAMHDCLLCATSPGTVWLCSPRRLTYRAWRAMQPLRWCCRWSARTVGSIWSPTRTKWLLWLAAGSRQGLAEPSYQSRTARRRRRRSQDTTPSFPWHRAASDRRYYEASRPTPSDPGNGTSRGSSCTALVHLIASSTRICSRIYWLRHRSGTPQPWTHRTCHGSCLQCLACG